ncbi:MAG: hypothetical protein ACXWUG_23565, partial [Polyangiales bacterium]
EPSGLHAVHSLLRSRERPAVDLLLFVGAVEAAKASCRKLPGHRDLNRCFRAPYEGAEGAVALEALEAFRAIRPEALVDIHNNTGRNPAYGVGVSADPGRLGVTGLFATRYVCSTIRLGALMESFGEETAIVTIECGRVLDPDADQRAIEGAARFASLDTLPRRADEADMEVLVDAVRVELAPSVTFAFGDDPLPDVELTIDRAVDRHNFQSLPAGTEIGWTSARAPLIAHRGDGIDVAPELFVVSHGVLLTQREMVPIMMTTSESAAREDCLFYACERRR